MRANEFITEGKNHPIIVVDVQPAYANNEFAVDDVAEKCRDIIYFVNNQTGPVLMFVNAEETGLTSDSIRSIKEYWDDTVCPRDDRYTYDEEYDDYVENPDCPTINWRRFTIVDKGFGHMRSWMDSGIPESTIIKTIRLLYQQKVTDSRELTFPGNRKERTPELSEVMGAVEQMDGDPLTVDWTSIAQLKQFSGAYIVGGGRNECLREVELLMNSFNIKYKRIDSLVY